MDLGLFLRSPASKREIDHHDGILLTMPITCDPHERIEIQSWWKIARVRRRAHAADAIRQNGEVDDDALTKSSMM